MTTYKQTISLQLHNHTYEIRDVRIDSCGNPIELTILSVNNKIKRYHLRYNACNHDKYWYYIVNRIDVTRADEHEQVLINNLAKRYLELFTIQTILE